MLRIILFVLLTFCFQVRAQLSGTLQVPATYSSLASVITQLNQQGISGAVLISISAGYTETVPNGGFSLTATGSATAPLVFQKNGAGANPKIHAYTGGSGTPGSANQDGIWRFIGCDFVTVDGIDLIDTNTIHPKTMEFGFGFFKTNGLDGCQNNTIKNCTVQLCRYNNASGASPAGDGSRAINLVNSVSNAQTTTLSVYAASGSNSFNRFYNNQFRNCNIGIYLNGFVDLVPYTLADQANDIGGATALTGNQIFDFGGGTNGNPAIGIRAIAQYDLNIANNIIKNNNGQVVGHSALLKGISIGAASGASNVVKQNTISLQGGGTNSALTLIENASGSAGNSNTVSISHNQLVDNTFPTAVNAAFYGIYNTASCSNLVINNNQFVNNSSSAVSGNTYLIYNTAAIPGRIELSYNLLGFSFDAVNSYSGTLYGIYNTGAALTTTLLMQGNYFSEFRCPKAVAGGSWYFIHNGADCAQFVLESNKFSNLRLNHSGAEYFMYNTSSTQSVLSVCNNSVIAIKRSGSAGNTYCYYAAANSAGTAIQTFSNNVFKDIEAPLSGTGNFYGIYNAEGNASPYPRKIVYENRIEDIFVNGTGNCYGIYCTGLGDASLGAGSVIYNNRLSNVGFGDATYGLYTTGAGSSVFPASISNNTITGIYSSGSAAVVCAAYLGNTSAGLQFFKNRISDIYTLGSSGLVHGVYGTTTSTTTVYNNLISNLSASASSGSNRVNGIYLNTGSCYNLYYNTVLLNSSSSGSVFGSNSLYASTTVSLSLKNNILVNLSVPAGTGLTAAYRRSSTNLTTYLVGSDNNLLYAGVPSASNLIFYNGTTTYQTLSAFQTALSTRDQNSVSQSPTFLSQLPSSPYFLHLSASTVNIAESGGMAVPSVGSDYDQQVRQGGGTYSGFGTAPDIGADEFELNLTPCIFVTSPSIVSSSLSGCAGQTYTLHANTFGVGSGYTYQWKSAQQSGGPYQNILGANSIELVTTNFSVGTVYFILETACPSASLNAISNELAVITHSLPFANPQISNTLVCAGSPIAFSSSSTNVNAWRWEGPNGFYSTTQSPSVAVSYSAASGIYSLSVSSAYCSSPVSTLAVLVNNFSLVTSSSNSFICNGASATLQALGPGLTFSWSNGAQTSSVLVSPTISTTYTVVATNSLGCSVTQAVPIAVIQPTIQCSGAAVCQTPTVVTLTSNAFGGSTVSWYSSLTASTVLDSGNTYTLSISSDTTLFASAYDNNSGCLSQRIPVSVTVSSYPTLSVSSTQFSICPGKTATLSVAGANTYTWLGLGSGSTKTVNPLSTIIYTVTGKNTYGCVGQTTLSIHVLALPVVSAQGSASFVCPSQAFVANAVGANSYTWSNGTIAPTVTLFPPADVTYTVYGSNTHNCVSSATLAVKTLTVPLVTISSSIDSICPGEPVPLTANGAISYTWLPDHQTETTCTVFPQTNAVVNAIGLSVNGCTAVAFYLISVKPCTGISETKEQAFTSVFPNPAEEVVWISCSPEFLGECHLQIIDVSARSVLDSKLLVSQLPFRMEINNIPPGAYYLRISNERGVSLTRGFLKVAN